MLWCINNNISIPQSMMLYKKKRFLQIKKRNSFKFLLKLIYGLIAYIHYKGMNI